MTVEKGRESVGVMDGFGQETAGELLQKFPRTPSKLFGFGEFAGLEIG